MRVAVVAGPDPGHAFPAIALCLRFLAAGDLPVLLTGRQWLDTARDAGVDARELLGLDPEDGDDDTDSGAKIHERAARMTVLNVPVLRELTPDLVVSDVITACGGMAAELMGLPWVELTRTRCICRRRGCRRWAVAWRPASACAVACGTPCCGFSRPARSARGTGNGPRRASESVCPQPIPGRRGG